MCRYLAAICLLLVLSLLLLQPEQTEGTFTSTALFPSCTGTGLPNFSYAKVVRAGPGNFACNLINPNAVFSPLTFTWYYYDTYPVPVACGNPDLPDGDQCCHTTASTTVTFNKTVYANTILGAQATSTGTVTAGAFLGRSVTYVAVRLGPHLNCATAYGQEARITTVALTIQNGPVCPAGTELEELCPGAKN